jgi:hypothetical protein
VRYISQLQRVTCTVTNSNDNSYFVLEVRNEVYFFKGVLNISRFLFSAHIITI